MNQPDTHATPAAEPDMRSVLKHEFLTLMGTIVGIGIALGALLLTTTGRIETRLDSAIAEAGADRRAFQAQAAADRHASHASMNEFRKRMDEHRADMQRLGERQARLEGQRETDTNP